MAEPRRRCRLFPYNAKLSADAALSVRACDVRPTHRYAQWLQRSGGSGTTEQTGRLPGAIRRPCSRIGRSSTSRCRCRCRQSSSRRVSINSVSSEMPSPRVQRARAGRTTISYTLPLGSSLVIATHHHDRLSNRLFNTLCIVCRHVVVATCPAVIYQPTTGACPVKRFCCTFGSV